MNRSSLGALLALNVVLVVVLALLTFAPAPAGAQGLGGIKGSDYVMVGGKVQGKTANVVYITDLNNAKMIAVYYDINRKSLTTIALRDIARDFAAPGQ